MTSIQRIKGADGVIIDSNSYLELPKALTKVTTDAIRNGMIRYNNEWKSFEGVIDFDDGSVAYRRFAQLDSNGRLLISQLPDSLTSGLEYKGTYDPVLDDIDPPFTSAPLPTPAASSSSQYYIIRGLQDVSAKHLQANPTSDPYVIFTPDNADGEWTEIKYYVGKDPSTGANTVVINAFARFDVSKIPLTGHDGLLMLVNDNPTLSDPFTTTNNPSIEMGLSDSDWVIITDTTIQRLRQSRVSIVAASVAYDNTILQSVKRQFVTNNNTAQGVLDNLGIYGLRRTGDSMTNDGTEGAGRLGVTYGTATAPSIAFNDGNSDPELNSGMIPSEWTDTSTGIFRPAVNSIGFTSNGTEKLRITNDQLIVYPKLLSDPTVPNILFSGVSNTQLGISAINNKIYFVSNSGTNVVLSEKSSLFDGDIIVVQDTTLGTSNSDSLTVNSSSTFNSDVDIKENTIIGTTNTNTLVVNASSTFNADSKFVADVSIDGNTIIGDASTDTLTVNASTTFNAPVTITDLTVTGNTILGDADTDTLTVNASSTFDGIAGFNKAVTFSDTTKFDEVATFNENVIFDTNSIILRNVSDSILTKTSTTLNLIMSNFDDFSILDGSTERVKFNRYGVKLPVLSPINDSLGEDGMIAYSTDRKSTIQRVDGVWRSIGSGSVEVVEFDQSDWTLSGSVYTMTFNSTMSYMNIVDASIQELSGARYVKVDVDTVSVSDTDVIVTVPSTIDNRFVGRIILQYV